MVDIVRQGKALYVGISRWPLEALKIAELYLRQHDTPLLIYQDRLNLLDHTPMEQGQLQFCREHGIGFISFSPLAQGLLTDRYLNGIPEDSRMALGTTLKRDVLTTELLQKLHDFNNQATKRGETLAEMALSWILEQEGVTSLIVGASSVAQLATNLKAIK